MTERQAFRALVVDDDTVVRWVAESLLEGLGFVVKAVEDGERALQALECQSYDVILMDCQMPELDGYETTRRIRRREAEGHRTVIIAVTAHSREEERRKCLAAGMDDYLSKPLRNDNLGAVLDRWLTLENGDDDQPVEQPLDSAGRLERKTRTELAREMAELYRHDGTTRVESMRRALARGDALELANAAHALGGSAVYLGAAALAKLCRELEETALQEGLSGCESRLQDLEEEHRRLLKELEHTLGKET